MDPRTGAGGWVPPATWLQPDHEDENAPIGWHFLLLVTGLAVALRLFHLGHQSLWIDELFTWRSCRPDAGIQFWTAFTQTFQGPLYVAAAWPLVRLASSEFMLRLPAAIAGVAAVPLMALMARQLFPPRTARLAALLLAISPFHIWYSQEARGYSLVILFGLAASLVFLIMARRGPRPGTAILYALLTVCGVGSNMSAFFLWTAHGLTLLLLVRPQRRADWGWWVVAFAGGVLAAVPWLLRATQVWAFERVVPGADTGFSLRGETTFTLLALPFTGFAFLFGHSLGPTLGELHQPDRVAIVRAQLPLLLGAGAVAAAAILPGLIFLRKRQWALLFWIVVPLFFLILLTVRNIKPFNPRYLAVCLPFVLLITAHGILCLPRRAGQVVMVLLLVLSLWSVAQYHFQPRYAKADLRHAAEWIAAQEHIQEPVLVPVVGVGRVFEHYYEGPGEVLQGDGEPPVTDDEAARSLLSRKFGDNPGGWIVLSRQWILDPGDRLPEVLAAEGTILVEQEFPGVRIFRWHRSE